MLLVKEEGAETYRDHTFFSRRKWKWNGLPVLEYVRNEFGPEAMIWVMSVGAGAAERKESSHYNTTFIMSDILQSHYNGIHMPVNPIDHIEWTRFKTDLKSSWVGLESSMDLLLEKLGLENLEATGTNFLRNRSDIEDKLKNLIDSSKSFYPLKRNVQSISGRDVSNGFLSLGGIRNLIMISRKTRYLKLMI